MRRQGGPGSVWLFIHVVVHDRIFASSVMWQPQEKEENSKENWFFLIAGN